MTPRSQAASSSAPLEVWFQRSVTLRQILDFAYQTGREKLPWKIRLVLPKVAVNIDD